MRRLKWYFIGENCIFADGKQEINDASINQVKAAFNTMGLFLGCDDVLSTGWKQPATLKILANLANTKTKIDVELSLCYLEQSKMYIQVSICMGQNALDGTLIRHKCKGTVQPQAGNRGIPDIRTGIVLADADRIFSQVYMGSKEWATDYTWEPPVALSVIQAQASSDQASSNDRKHKGIVYLLKVGPWYKIGKTIDPEGRMRRLDIQLPEKAKKVHEIHTDNIDLLERHWHRYFADRRGNGEWFLLTPEDVEEFKAYKHVAL